MRRPKSTPGVARLIGLLSCTLAAAQRPATPATVTLFEGARLIAGDGGAPIENSAFLVEGTRFARVGRRGEIQTPAGAARVDLSGKTVIPALVDAHSHIGYMRNMTSGAQNYTRDNILDHMRRMRQAAFPITTVAGALASVQELVPRHTVLVKTWVDDRGGTVKCMAPELYTAIIDEAHRHNVRVAVHATGLQDAKKLLRANVNVFAYMRSVFLRHMLRRARGCVRSGVAGDAAGTSAHGWPAATSRLQTGSRRCR